MNQMKYLNRYYTINLITLKKLIKTVYSVTWNYFTIFDILLEPQLDDRSVYKRRNIGTSELPYFLFTFITKFSSHINLRLQEYPRPRPTDQPVLKF
ncbi:unnamed protein product [Rhizophagus irregularis]|nr:unnamed protein product [Rhizophagus irregularis]